MAEDWSRRAVLTSIAGGFAGCSAVLPSRDSTDQTDTQVKTDGPTTQTVETQSPTNKSPSDEIERLAANEPWMSWAIRLPGPVNNPPAVNLSKGRLYVGTGNSQNSTSDSDDSDVKTGMYALETATGALAWHAMTPMPIVQRPIVHDGRVHVVSGNSTGYTGMDQRIITYDFTGTKQWASEPRNEFVSIIATAEGTLFAGTSDDEYQLSGQSLFAIGPNGEVQWDREAGDARGGTFTDGLVLYNAALAAVAAYDPTDGSTVWQVGNEAVGGPPNNITTFDGLCFTESDPDSSGDSALVAHSTADGTEQWRYSTTPNKAANFALGTVVKVPAVGEAVQTEAELIGTGGGSKVFALRGDDGTEQWTFTADAQRFTDAAVSDAVYVSDTAGTVYALSVSDGHERWRVSLPNAAALWPLSDGVLAYTFGEGRTIVSVTSTGKRRWSFTSSEGLTRPVLTDTTAYSCASDGTVFAFDPIPS